MKFYQYDLRLAKIHTEALITAWQEKCILVSLSPFQLLVISLDLFLTEVMKVFLYGTVFELFCTA